MRKLVSAYAKMSGWMSTVFLKIKQPSTKLANANATNDHSTTPAASKV